MKPVPCAMKAPMAVRLSRHFNNVRRTFWYIWISILLVMLLGCSKQGVSPDKVDVYLSPGEKDRFVMQIDLARALPSYEPLDILLLFDATGSMGNVIDEVKKRSQEIMRSIRDLYVNSAFGVAAIYDYKPQKQPWRLYQSLSLDVNQVSESLQKVELSGGGDWPEAYVRGLYESRFLNWRKDARKYIILFGDAPAHDPEFYGVDYGVDPGRDGIEGTSDDLFLRPVIQQLKQDSITVISVYDKGGWFKGKPETKNALKGFKFMAQETGGICIPVRSSSDVPEAIKAGIREAYRPPPAIFVPAEYKEWVITDGVTRKGASGRRFKSPITLRPPDGTTDGIYQFPILAMHGGELAGGEIGRTSVMIRIGLANYDWRWLFLWLYLLLLFLLILWKILKRRVAGETAVRFFRNFPYLRLGWRILRVVILVVILYLILRHVPGSIPSTPSDASFGPLVPVSESKVMNTPE